MGNVTGPEIRRTLELNIGRTIEVRWRDDSNELVKVINVDDEGFVYDLVPPDPKTPFWATFDELREIRPDITGNANGRIERFEG
jgi:hypothetical protein